MVRLRAALVFVVAAALGAGLWFWWNRTEPVAPIADRRAPSVAEPPAPRVDAAPAPADAPGGADSGTPVRSPLPGLPPTPEPPTQGVRGRVVDAGGNAVPGVRLYLFAHASGDPFHAVLSQDERGDTPLASGTSGDDGAFALALAEVDAKAHYELRLTSEVHRDGARGGLALSQGEWHDIGAIGVVDGAVVHGVVRGQDGAPLAGATVRVEPAQPPLSLYPTPGRERGIAAHTDADGRYRIANATPGRASLSAEAPGHARVDEPRVDVVQDGDNAFDFTLPLGLSISGIVVATDGTAIPRARLFAIKESGQNLPLRTTADEEGRFRFDGLANGTFTLSAEAEGFLAGSALGVAAGSDNGRIELEPLGAAWVSVIGRDGARLDRFGLQVVTWDPSQDRYGATLGGTQRAVTPGDLVDGRFRFEGVDAGHFAFVAEADGYAKTFSKPIEFVRGGPVRDVTIEMTAGGTIRGRTVGSDGHAVAGATITSLDNSFEDSPLAGVFGRLMLFPTTRKDTASGGDGAFRLEHLARGTYQVRFRHPSVATWHVRDVVVRDGAIVDLGEVRLERGVELSGVVHVDGEPGRQVKVSVSSLDHALTPGRAAIAADAVTGDDGRFVLAERLPPGRYQARAGRQINPFLQIADFGRTAVEFEIAAGATGHRLEFEITSQ